MAHKAFTAQKYFLLFQKKSNLVSFGVHAKDEKLYWSALNGGPQNAMSIS